MFGILTSSFLDLLFADFLEAETTVPLNVLRLLGLVKITPGVLATMQRPFSFESCSDEESSRNRLFHICFPDEDIWKDTGIPDLLFQGFSVQRSVQRKLETSIYEIVRPESLFLGWGWKQRYTWR